MANSLAEVTPQLLAQGLQALRQQSIMPLLVNRSYESMAGQKGSTIDVPVPSAITAQDVSPSNTPPSTADIAPSSVSIQLDQWKEAPFQLTDKDMAEAMEGTIPMQASEAIKSLANAVDNYILSQYVKIYGFAGTAGTTPFDPSGDGVQSATEVRKVLNNQLAPLADRRLVIDPETEANALSLRAFHDASFTNQTEAILQGQINERLGFGFFMDQNIPTHSAGGGDGSYDGSNETVDGSHTAGTNTLSVTNDGSAGNFSFNEGDIIEIAGHSQTYVVRADASMSGGGSVNITIEPELQVSLSGGEALTLKDDHTVNLAFHRDAIAFANRPLEQDAQGLGVIVQSAVDPVSGLTLRLEITREHKRTRFSYDILYGAQVVRPELAARLAG